MKDLPRSVLVALSVSSLLLNTWFLRGMAEDLRKLQSSYHDLRVENASRDALLNSVNTRQEVTEIKMQRMEEMVRALARR